MGRYEKISDAEALQLSLGTSQVLVDALRRSAPLRLQMMHKADADKIMAKAMVDAAVRLLSEAGAGKDFVIMVLEDMIESLEEQDVQNT